MRKLAYEVKDFFESLVKADALKTKGWPTQTEVLKGRKGPQTILAITSYKVRTNHPEDQGYFLYRRY